MNTDDIKIETINKLLKQVADTFSNADNPNMSRHEWIKKNNIKTGIDYSFSLTADDIINQKIPRPVAGCTGTARLFSTYAEQLGLKTNIILTAKLSDLENPNNSPINGHQIMMVEFSDGPRIFDPGRRVLEFIKATPKIGSIIKAIGTDNPDYIITSILPLYEYNKIKTYKDLENHYLSVNNENPKTLHNNQQREI